MSTRRQLFRAVLGGVASLPFAARAENGGDKNDGRGSRGNDDRGYGWGTTSGGSSSTARGGAGCLLRGTKIATPAGERLVEDLKIGDEINTLSGPKPIKWIGYDKFTKAEERPWPDSVMPIRLARFAINDLSPYSELYLSPLHCVYFNETLIPVKYLINGASIMRSAWSAPACIIEYYHIDLGTHEVIYAEGALVESFFDGICGREFYSNFVQYERLYGAEPQKMKPFAPILDYHNRSQRMAGAMRSAVSRFVDIRDPIQMAHDQIARRAEALFV